MQKDAKIEAASKGAMRAFSGNKILVTGFGRMGLSHAALYNLYRADAPCDIDVFDPSKKLRLALKLSKRLHRMTPIKRLDKANLNRYKAIFICSPPKAHTSNLRDISGYSGQVFLEKPGFVDARDMGGLNPEKVYVGYVLRHSPAIKEIEALANGRPLSALDIALTTNVTFGTDTENWRDSHAHGGGLLNEFGSHCINLMLCLARKNVRLTGVETSGPNQFLLSFSSADADTDARPFTVSLSASDSRVRKAVYTVSARVKDGPSVWTDLSSVSVANDGGDMPDDHPEKRFLAEGPLSSKAYLRGHEFSRQMAYFTKNTSYKGSVDDSIATDELLRTAHDLINPR